MATGVAVEGEAPGAGRGELDGEAGGAHLLGQHRVDLLGQLIRVGERPVGDEDLGVVVRGAGVGAGGAPLDGEARYQRASL